MFALPAIAQHTAVFHNPNDLHAVTDDRVHLEFDLQEPLQQHELDALNEFATENAPIIDVVFDDLHVSISLFHRSSVQSVWQKIFFTMDVETFVIQHAPDKFTSGTIEDFIKFYNISE